MGALICHISRHFLFSAGLCASLGGRSWRQHCYSAATGRLGGSGHAHFASGRRGQVLEGALHGGRQVLRSGYLWNAYLAVIHIASETLKQLWLFFCFCKVAKSSWPRDHQHRSGPSVPELVERLRGRGPGCCCQQSERWGVPLPASQSLMSLWKEPHNNTLIPWPVYLCSVLWKFAWRQQGDHHHDSYSAMRQGTHFNLAHLFMKLRVAEQLCRTVPAKFSEGGT